MQGIGELAVDCSGKTYTIQLSDTSEELGYMILPCRSGLLGQ